MTTTLLIDLLWKTTLMFVAAGVAALLLRRAAAATRHVIWTLALVGVVALPALAWLPGWNVPLLAPWSDVASRPETPIVLATFPAPQIAQKPGNDVDVPAHLAQVAATPQVSTNDFADTVLAPSLSLESRLVLVWAIGALTSLLAIAFALVRLERLTHRCTKITSGRIHELAAGLARDFRIRRPVRLLTSTERTIPMT